MTHLPTHHTHQVYPGEAVLLRAPSGGGKSSLIKAIAGLYPYHQEGRVAFAGLGVYEGMRGGAFFVPQVCAA